ncbi:hypothetical protein BJ138DRAFT_1152056 [Hygrophoropsis aurantiaca]|uniref:Uncharacterized protein n=1 Tax=Hygrophoropsis aurantiaca TaxID=72124 RepID=A0ACB8AC14_9AGAM|nr:hypothetical protein BJ138DRAFT_1152056 [Hygrophoropsis aurantiaca]
MMSDISLADFSKDFSQNNLVPTLNNLLGALALPFTLESPTDLTPSLLLAVLESILESRLPIPQSIRESRSSSAKIEAMKVFLGVLECDVLEMDVGLSEVDPSNLALGMWDEIVFVGELLCWLGKRRGIIYVPLDGSHSEDGVDLSTSILLRPEPTVTMLSHITDVPRHPRVASPSTRSTATTSMNTDLSMHSSHTSSDTSILGSLASTHRTVHAHTRTPSPAPSSPSPSPSPTRPRCIHELADPSFIIPPDQSIETSFNSNASQSLCDCSIMPPSPSPQPAPVRYTGWIGEVDSEAEIRLFEASRRRTTPVRRSSGLYTQDGLSGPRIPSSSQHRSPPSAGNRTSSATQSRTPSSSQKRTTNPYVSPSEHTIALLNERARLLSELANLRKARRVT